MSVSQLKVGLSVLLLSGVVLLGGLSFLSVQRAFEEAGFLSAGGPVPAASFDVPALPQGTVAFVLVFWTFTLLALLGLGCLPLRRARR